MKELAKTAAAAPALVVCKDALTCRLITESLQSLATRPEICEEVFAAARLLNSQKFEAVIVDLLLGDGAVRIVEQLRSSRTNRTAVTFAITSGDGTGTSGVRLSSTFVLPRPLSADSINQVLRAAYGLVVRERRRTFGAPSQFPRSLEHSNPRSSCAKP